MRKSCIFAILIAVCTLAGCNTGGIEPPIASEKLLKYVFISIPSGYEVASDGVLPRMSV